MKLKKLALFAGILTFTNLVNQSYGKEYLCPDLTQTPIECKTTSTGWLCEPQGGNWDRWQVTVYKQKGMEKPVFEKFISAQLRKDAYYPLSCTYSTTQGQLDMRSIEYNSDASRCSPINGPDGKAVGFNCS